MDRLLYFFICLLTALSRGSKALSRLGIGNYEEWKPGQKIKILLAGYNGARNTGSDVRVVSIANQVKELFGEENVELTVMTMNTESLAGYFDDDVELFKFSSLYPIPLFKVCNRSHAAVLCEGSALKSTFANALTLFLCEASGIMTAQGKPSIGYGSEVGRMEDFLTKAVKKLCKGTYIITRTKGSFDALKKLGLKGHVGTDAAWTFDREIGPDEAESLLREQGWNGRSDLLGIAVIDPFCWPVRASLRKWVRTIRTGDREGQYDKWYYFSESPERSESFERYIREIADAVRSYMQENDCFPVILGMERLDEKACKAVRSRLGVPSAMFLSGENNAAVMTGILRRLSMLVTSRYHAAVLSMERSCPIIAISMDERLDGLMKELSMDGKYLLHVDDADLGAELRRALAGAGAESDSIHAEIKEKLPEYKNMLNEMGQFLRQYILDGLDNAASNT